MAKNVQNLSRLGVKKGGALIGGGALNGEFTVGGSLVTNVSMVKDNINKVCLASIGW